MPIEEGISAPALCHPSPAIRSLSVGSYPLYVPCTESVCACAREFSRYLIGRRELHPYVLFYDGGAEKSKGACPVSSVFSHPLGEKQHWSFCACAFGSPAFSRRRDASALARPLTHAHRSKRGGGRKKKSPVRMRISILLSLWWRPRERRDKNQSARLRATRFPLARTRRRRQKRRRRRRLSLCGDSVRGAQALPPPRLLPRIGRPRRRRRSRGSSS